MADFMIQLPDAQPHSAAKDACVDSRAHTYTKTGRVINLKTLIPEA